MVYHTTKIRKPYRGAAPDHPRGIALIRSQLILPDSGCIVGCIDRGAGEPLLLVHGVGLRAEAWQPQIDRFADRFRVIAVDLPGHGESTGLTGDPLLPAYVDWLDRVVTVLDLRA